MTVLELVGILQGWPQDDPVFIATIWTQGGRYLNTTEKKDGPAKSS